MHTAEARGLNLNVGAGQSAVELRFELRGFIGAVKPQQTLVVAVEAPDVVWVLAGSGQRVVQPKIGGVHRSGRLDLPLFEQ